MYRAGLRENGATADPQEHYRTTLDQGLAQLRGEVRACDFAWRQVNASVQQHLEENNIRPLCLQVEGMGEALVSIGSPNGWGPAPLTAQQVDEVLAELTADMDGVGADVTVLRRRAECTSVKGEATLCTSLQMRLYSGRQQQKSAWMT